MGGVGDYKVKDILEPSKLPIKCSISPQPPAIWRRQAEEVENLDFYLDPINRLINPGKNPFDDANMGK